MAMTEKELTEVIAKTHIILPEELKEWFENGSESKDNKLKKLEDWAKKAENGASIVWNRVGNYEHSSAEAEDAFDAFLKCIIYANTFERLKEEYDYRKKPRAPKKRGRKKRTAKKKTGTG